MSITLEKSDIPPELESPEPAEDEKSEEAPYGYKKDGTPRKAPGRKPGAGGGGGTSRSLNSLREPLIERLTDYIGGGLIVVSPIGAAVWEERAERTADAILVLAARSPRWRKTVERFVAGSAGGDIGLTVAGVFTGILVDTGRMQPVGKIPHYFRIDTIYEELYGTYTEAQNGDHSRGLMTEI